jgi:hypothetical protein
MGAILTEWNPANFDNVVTDGAYTFRNCLVVGDPQKLVVGRVLLQFTPGGPVILGNSYQSTSAVIIPNPDPDPDPNPDPDPDPNPDPDPDPDPDPSPGTGTGGSGGLLTDRLNVSYTNSAGIASSGHIYAAGLDWTRRVGILVYCDGSGEFGLENPTSSYLLAGTNGLVAVAKKHNMLLVTPKAPGGPCDDGDGDCWYDSSGAMVTATKIKWADDFIRDEVLTKYNVDRARAVVAGYSSGSQFTMEYYAPQYASEWMQDGLLLAITYGGSPKVTANFPTAFKQNVAAVWDVGDNDPSYTDEPPWDSQSGYDWYTSNGFDTTDITVVPGENHSRDGQFGGIVDREITQHVITASGAAPGGGTPGPGPGPVVPSGPVPWTRTYPDGTSYPLITGGGTGSAVSLSNLASAASNSVYNYTGSTITGATSVDFTGKSNITIKGITMGAGGKLTPKAGTNIVLEISAPYELSDGGETVKWVGMFDRVRIDNSLFGPASPAGSPTTTKSRFIQFGDSTSVGAKFGTVTRTTFRNKNGPGNMVHTVGDTEQAQGGVRYTLLSQCLFIGCKPFDENDHESALMGISTLQLTDGQQVIEFCRFDDCRSEPEVISMKMNKSIIRGCTYHNCVGSFSLRHGDDGAIHDCWIYGFEEETGGGSYNRTSAGPRLYGARHKIYNNTIQVNGNGGSRPSVTSLYESPLTLDSGDVAPGSTSNGHANIVGVLVEKNLLVKCGNPIMVVDNYGTAPTGIVRNNWIVQCTNTPADGVGTKGSSPSKAGLTISGNTVYPTTSGAGLTTGSGGHFVAPASADRGARVVYLTASMVGQGATFDPWV